MDVLRSCYRSQMRLFQDRPDVLTWGQWHFCLPGAKPLPFFHRWASSVFDPDDLRQNPDLGEVRPRGVWTAGRPDPRLLGQQWCGHPNVWLEGVPLAERGTPVVDGTGLPPCCLPSEGAGQGGLDLGGTIVLERAVGVDPLSEGGWLVGGYPTVEGETADEPVVIGGILDGGYPTVEGAVGYETVTGGIVLGGDVCDMCIQTLTVTSGELVGGGVADTVNVGLATSGVTAGTYGDASHSARVTVDNKGRITTASAPAIAIAAAAVSGLAAVATTGSYADVAGLSTVAHTGAAGDLSGLATVATSGSAADLTGTLAAARLPTTVPIAGTVATFPQWQLWTLSIVSGKLRVTAPDGSTTDTTLPGTTSMTVTVTSPAALGVLEAIFHQATTLFTGTGILSVSGSLGYSGGAGTPASNTTAYLSAAAIGTGTNPKPNAVTTGQPDCEHPTAAWNITATLVSGGANLSALTAGTWKVWLRTGVL